MKRRGSIKIETALLLLVLFSTSCNHKINSELVATDNNRISKVGNSSTEHSALPETDYAEFWKFVLNIERLPIKSNSELEDHIIRSLDYIERLSIPISFPALSAFNNMLYLSHYKRSAVKLGYLTLNRTEGTNAYETRVKAAATLTNHFEFHKQRDSLAKYLRVIEDVMRYYENPWIRVVYHSDKANLADLKGDYFEAAVNSHAALEYVEPDNYDHLSTLYQNLATIYLRMDYPERALSFTLKSIRYKDINNLTNNYLNSIAVTLSKSGYFEHAEIIYSELMNRALLNGNSIELAMAYTNKGNLKRRQNQYSASLEYFALSDSICTSVGMDFGLMVNGINKGETYLLSGEYHSAFKTLKKAEEQMASYTIPSIEIELFRLLSEVYEALGEQSLSDRYFRRHMNLKKNHIGDYPRSMIKEWENQKERLSHAVSRNRYEQQLLKEANEKYLIALISFAGLTLGLFFFLVRERKNHAIREKISREKQAIAYELEIKSKELLAESLKDIYLANLRENLRIEILESIKEMPETHKSKLQPILQSLQNNNLNKLYSGFDENLNRVHESFYNQLKEIAPDLTPGELRLCGMIRVGMSSKDISLLTNRTVRTVENSRSIVRKKLGLTGDANLQSFLSSSLPGNLNL